MIKYIWAIFALVFVSFALYHFKRATKSFPKIPSAAGIKTINGVPVGVVELVTEFNKYIDDLNRDSIAINIWTGIAYLVNAFIALFSYLLS